MEEGFFGHPWTDGPMFDKHWAKFQMIQARRGDMRGIILRALLERPMHGYEIIRYLEESSHGMWRPSPGSIYPTLQLLEEEDMVSSQEENSKKIYSLTETGETEAKNTKPFEPWKRHDGKGRREFRELVADIMHAFKKIMRANDETLNKQAMEILRSTRNQLMVLTEKRKDV